MNLTCTLIAASLLVVSGPIQLRAQELPASGETLHVNLVEIPVNVFDREGNAIRGLKPENFEVYDDGEPRRVTHFEEIDLATLSVEEPQVLSAAARRSFMLVFDLSHSSPRTILRAREAAMEFIETTPRRDLVSVATFSIEAGFQILTAFTTDRDYLLDAIRTLGFSRFYETMDPLLLGGVSELGMMSSNSLQPESVIDRELSEIMGHIRRQVRANEDSIRRNRVERQLASFEALARVLDSVRGRKQVVLLSEGFDARLIQGQEQMTGPEVELDQNAQFRGEVWRVDSDRRFGNTQAQRSLDDMARMFRTSDVVLHAIDIKGLRAPNDPRTGSQRTSSESLFMISHPTGGEVFRNSNDLTAAFARMLKQQEVVYVLGFQTRPSKNPGKFHDLKVRVRVVGYDGLRVSHRAGYYEPRNQISAVEQLLSATDILMNDIPFEQIPTSVLATPFPQQEGNAEVPVVVEISGSGLIDMVPGDVVNGELFIYAFDENLSVKDYLFQIFSLDLARVREVIESSGLKYYGVLTLPAGDYTIKTLVRVAESGHKGFTRTRIRVPAYGERAILPPLVFEDPGRWILLKGASKAGGDIRYPFTLGQESFIPSARPVVSRSGDHELALFAYNLAPDGLELTASLTGRDGRPRSANLTLVGRTETGRDGLLKLLFQFDSRELEPGEYRLDVRLPASPEEPAQEVSLELVVSDERDR